ncbi:MAG TPA: DUF2059 domain-containing protein [Devosia sp.]|nr:DUF2059 domain-containing protein [Devosia sp.]
MMTKFANTFKKLVVAILLSATLTSVAPAQELSPEHLDIARRYVDLTDQANLYEATLIETGIATMRILISQNPDIADQVSAAIGEVIKSYAERKDELFDQFARVYASRLTQEELTTIVEFYETEVGRKLLQENAAANRDLQAVIGVFTNNLNREFFAAVRAILREQGIDS